MDKGSGKRCGMTGCRSSGTQTWPLPTLECLLQAGWLVRTSQHPASRVRALPASPVSVARKECTRKKVEQDPSTRPCVKGREGRTGRCKWKRARGASMRREAPQLKPASQTFLLQPRHRLCSHRARPHQLNGRHARAHNAQTLAAVALEVAAADAQLLRTAEHSREQEVVRRVG